METKFLKPLVCAATLPLLLQSVSAMAEPRTYSVCELKAQGPMLNGQKVRLHAEFTTDLNHAVFFLDPACPHSIIYEDEPPLPAKDQSVLNFDHALWHGAPFRSLKFDVDVSGTFEWEKQWQPPANLSAFMKPQPRGVLLIEKVWSFKRLPEDQKDHRH